MASGFPATFKIKFENNEEMKRFPAVNTFGQVTKYIRESWGNEGSIVLFYLDEDNDLIKVTNDADLEEAILVAKDMGNKVLKFNARIVSCNIQKKLNVRFTADDIQKQIKLNKVKRESKVQTYPPKYLSMLNAGVAKEAVMQRMKVDGYDIQPAACMPLSKLYAILKGQYSPSSTTSSSTSLIPEVKKSDCVLPPVYNKMLRAGVLWEAVVQRMKIDGYNEEQLSSASCQYNIINVALKKSSSTSLRKPAMVGSISRSVLCESIRKGKLLRKTSSSSTHPSLLSHERHLEAIRQASMVKSAQCPVSAPRMRSNSMPTAMLSDIRGFSPQPSLNHVSKCKKQVSFAGVVANAIPSTRAPPPPPPMEPTIPARRDTLPSEQEKKLLRMEAMGFNDKEQNKILLALCSGSLERAVDRLLNL